MLLFMSYSSAIQVMIIFILLFSSKYFVYFKSFFVVCKTWDKDNIHASCV